jgi:hypothetical protein
MTNPQNIPIRKATIENSHISLYDYDDRKLHVRYLTLCSADPVAMCYMCTIEFNDYMDLNMIVNDYCINIKQDDFTIPFCICIAKTAILHDSYVNLDNEINIPITKHIIKGLDIRRNINKIPTEFVFYKNKIWKDTVKLMKCR